MKTLNNVSNNGSQNESECVQKGKYDNNLFTYGIHSPYLKIS
jgi:hypothetical protein